MLGHSCLLGPHVQLRSCHSTQSPRVLRHPIAQQITHHYCTIGKQSCSCLYLRHGHGTDLSISPMLPMMVAARAKQPPPNPLKAKFVNGRQVITIIVRGASDIRPTFFQVQVLSSPLLETALLLLGMAFVLLCLMYQSSSFPDWAC